MLTTTQLKEYAQLSQAAYAYFDNTLLGRTAKEVEKKLKQEKKGDFTEIEANEFTTRYELLDQYVANSYSSGFSASLFRDKSDGHLVLAFRGTEVPGDWVNDLAITDSRIGIDGYASTQAIEEYRYIKRLMTAKGDMVQYSADELEKLKNIFFDMQPVTMEPHDIDAYNALWDSYKASMLVDPGIDAGQPTGQALITAGAAIDLVGHSLGGHLAMLADRFFPQLNVQNIVTLNAPGFYGQAESILSQYSSGWDEDKILRMEAAGDGVSEFGSKFPGVRALIGQENSVGAIAAISTNHSSINSTDGLKLTELLGMLDSSIMADARLAKPLMDAAASVPNQSYENLLDSVRRIFLGDNITSTPVAVGVNASSRNAFYKNINDLESNSTFQALSGKVNIQLSSGSFESTARTDFSAFLSLYNLSPVYLKASGISQDTLNTTLGAASNDIYSQWQSDNALTAEERANGKANISDKYLHDRAAMLSWQILANQADLNTLVTTVSPDDWVFIDAATNGRVTNRNLTSTTVAHQVYFGGSGPDSFSGGAMFADQYIGALKRRSAV